MTEQAEVELRRRFVTRVGASVAVLGLWYAALCIAGRVASPWPLEWMEGASAQHALRLFRGLPLYAAPRADFIPFVYPPLSYVPMGLGLMLSAGALWGARLANVIALMLCCAALWRAGKHISGRHAAGRMAAGLFAMGYGYTGGFIDLARVDAWFCAASLWGVERVCAGRHAHGLLLLALACFAKQHAVLLLTAASGGSVLMHGRGAVRGVAASWLGLAVGVAVLCALTGGWIWTYCVTVPARHGIEPRLLVSFVLVDLCVYLPVLTGLSVLFCATHRDARALLLGLLLLAAVGASALGRAHPGGDDNVRLPAYALLALVAAISCCTLLETRPELRWPLTAALLVQVAMLFQPPTLYWPTRQSTEAFSALKAELEGCAGSSDFAAMDHAGLGAHGFVHTLALSDLRMNRDLLAKQATEAVLFALRSPATLSEREHLEKSSEGRVAEPAPRAFAISSSFPALMETLAERYELCARVPAMPMPTGYPIAETFIYRRKD